jgi:hypothetical protein
MLDVEFAYPWIGHSDAPGERLRENGPKLMHCVSNIRLGWPVPGGVADWEGLWRVLRKG